MVEASSTVLESSVTSCPVTVIVPAYNEADCIADTVNSLLKQSLMPEKIIVIDDGSTDNTAEICIALGVTVITPPQNTGSKAGAQNHALTHINTEYTLAIDADTTLKEDALEKLFSAMGDPDVVAACGFVIPQKVSTLWERGRYVEYLMAFTFYKEVQEYYEKPLISSGCFSLFRTEYLQQINGWSLQTMAEDMDLTWTAYQLGKKVRFIPKAICYPIEPHNFHFMRKQLKRWAHGFIQNVRLHRKGLLQVPFLRSVVTVMCWDASIASIFYLIALPILALVVSPAFLLGYIIDLPMILVPTLVKAYSRGETWKALASIPAFLVLRVVNSAIFLEAIFNEFILKNTLTTYEKGH
jgi:biofilm PGA synthesis N-glycosyltransferase PgaC